MNTVVRWNPTRPALFDRAAGPSLDRFFSTFFAPTRWAEEDDIASTTWVPAADVRETEEAFFVDLELAGLTKEDIGVSFEQNVLTVTGERRFTKNETGETLHRVERSYGKFSRSFRLPRAVDTAKVQATFADGVLRLVLPKTAEARPRQIQIS